jgi:hypothetical protein
MKPIHKCKIHGKDYTVCPQCQCEYCELTWPVCPRLSWHPSHGTTAEESGRRYQALQLAREQSARNRAEYSQ